MLRPPADECDTPAPVSAVAISCCGNFGFVGSAAGRVDRYNMQSGLHRGSYQRWAPIAQTGGLQMRLLHGPRRTQSDSTPCQRSKFAVTTGVTARRPLFLAGQRTMEPSAAFLQMHATGWW